MGISGCQGPRSSVPSIKASKNINDLKSSDEFYCVEMYVVKLLDGTYALASTQETNAGMWFESEDEVLIDGKSVKVAKDGKKLARLELTAEAERYLFCVLKSKKPEEQQAILKDLYESGDKKAGKNAVAIPSSNAGPEFREEAVPNNGYIESLEAFLAVNGGNMFDYPYCNSGLISDLYTIPSEKPRVKYYIVALEEGDYKFFTFVRSDNGSFPFDPENSLNSFPLLMKKTGEITSFSISDYIEIPPELALYLKQMEDQGFSNLMMTKGDVDGGAYIEAIFDTLLRSTDYKSDYHAQIFDRLSFGLNDSEKLALDFHMRLFPREFELLSLVLFVNQQMIQDIINSGASSDAILEALKVLNNEMSVRTNENTGISLKDFKIFLNAFSNLALLARQDNKSTGALVWQKKNMMDSLERLNRDFFIPRGFEVEVCTAEDGIPYIVAYRQLRVAKVNFFGHSGFSMKVKIRDRMDRSPIKEGVGFAKKSDNGTWGVVVNRSACNFRFIELGKALADYRYDITSYQKGILPLDVLKTLFTRQAQVGNEDINTSIAKFANNYILCFASLATFDKKATPDMTEYQSNLTVVAYGAAPFAYIANILFRAYRKEEITIGEQNLINNFIKELVTDKTEAGKLIGAFKELTQPVSLAFLSVGYEYTPEFEEILAKCFCSFVTVDESALRQHAKKLLQGSTGVKNIVVTGQ